MNETKNIVSITDVILEPIKKMSIRVFQVFRVRYANVLGMNAPTFAYSRFCAFLTAHFLTSPQLFKIKNEILWLSGKITYLWLKIYSCSIICGNNERSAFL